MLTTAGAGLIERPAVAARIVAALRDGSVLLIAGAGYGKTTALHQALSHGESRAAWVRCRDAGNDGGRLLALLLHAVRVASPGAADALAERLANGRAPIDAALAAGALERELASVLVERLVIVFDDVETLTNSSTALAVITPLLLSDSPLLRVALASRHPPAIPIARERAMGRLTVLGPAELAFTATDCARFLAVATGRDQDRGAVEALLEETDGWPLGVALAASGGDGSLSAPSPALAHDYLAEEVFDPLDADLRRALLLGSLAPDLQVADRAGLSPSEGFAVAIDHHALLLRLAAPGDGLELHPLFREFLRARLDAEISAQERCLAARQIARALEDLGRPVEAVEYHLSGRDWPRATTAIAREGHALVRSAADTVAGWIAELPPERRKDPELQLLAGELAHGNGEFAAAIELCRAAVQGADSSAKPTAQRFVARFALADALMAAGDLAGVAELADVLDEPDAAGNPLARATGVVAAAGLARQGQFAEARELFARALDDPGAAPLAGLAAAFAAYYLELPSGQLDDALAHAREAVATLETADPTGRLPYALTFLMAVLDERGEDHEALTVARRTREWSRRAGLSGWVGVALAIRSASLRVRMGDVVGAETDLAEVPPAWAVWGAWELDATRAAIASLRGDGDAALSAADRAARRCEREWPYFDRARCAALLAPTLVRAGYPQRARDVVERTIADRIPGFSTARLHAVLAWMLHDEGDEDGSSKALLAASTRAGDQFTHIVRREWPRIERPIWAALAHGAIDIDLAVKALAAARSGAIALAGFIDHPVPAVRRAALVGSVAAGHPRGIERVLRLQSDPDPTVAQSAKVAAGQLRRSPPPLTFRLLGHFELRRGTWLVDDAAWERRVAQRVIRLLLCRDRGPVPEDELIEAFWPERAVASARRSVQVAVSAARAVLDPPGAAHSRLACSERSYRLELLDQDTVDAEQFERAATTALAADPDSRRAALLASAAMWTGEPLPEERYAEWAASWRERLTDRYTEVLTALSREHEQAGEMSQAISAARRLVDLDPLNEAAHRRLIIAYARTGRRGHALRQFLECRHALITALGVEPGEETAALHRQVLSGERV